MADETLLSSEQIEAERQRAKRGEMLARLKARDPGFNEQDAIVIFGYSLCDRVTDESKTDQRVDGLCVLTRDSLIVYNGNTRVREIKLADATDFRITAGVGSVSADCTIDGSDYLICRSDSSQTAEYGAIMKRINHFKETGEFKDDYVNDLVRFCEKCGRPLPPGSSTCPHCIDKKSVMKRLWDIAKPFKWRIIISVAMFFVISAVNLLTPWVNRIMVDDFIESPNPENVVLFEFVIVVMSLAFINIFVNILSVIRSRILIATSNKVIVRLREMVFGKIQQMSIARISKRTSGELMNRVNGDTAQIQDFVTNMLPDVLQQTIMLISIAVMLFVYDWKLALLIILPAPIVSISFRFFWNFMHRLYDKSWQISSTTDAVLYDIFSGIRVVKAFGMEAREADRFDKGARELRDVTIKTERTWQLIFPWLNFFMGIGEFFLLYYGGTKILGGEMTLGQMVQFSAYVSLIYGPLRWYANLPRWVARFTTSVAKVFEIIDEKIDVPDRENAKDIKIKGTIDFENVSFGYNETTEVLKKVNLHVEPGEMIGIVGKSGVGKSTLINLLMRLYDVNEGAIKVDGIDIRDLSQDCLRSQTGIVLQETFLFAGTIYDNIAYAKPDATRDEIITAAKIAGAHEFIMKLPDAYNTKVGERGHTLSGGERQRVSIARALLHNPRILILDEATASLDTETERQIQESLQKLTRDRTTFAIAHRLSTLRNATRLIVLDKGTIAEVGTHDELLRKKGIYYGLVMAQRQMSKMAPKNSESA